MRRQAAVQVNENDKEMEEQDSEEDLEDHQFGGGSKNPPRRANKNRPMEISSKKPVPRFREVIQPTRKEIRDPRFESLSGKFNESGFRKAYGFVFDEVLPAEKERLNQERTKVKRRGGGDMNELENDFMRVERLLKEDHKNQAKKLRERELREKQLDQIKQGKRPFFLKKSEKRKFELMDKFEELKEKGQLDAYLAKKRKKNAAKDRRFMPNRRPPPVQSGRQR